MVPADCQLMYRRFIVFVLLPMLTLGFATQARADHPRASFSISITILATCTTMVDDDSGKVREWCNHPRPYRVSIVPAPPAPRTEQVTSGRCTSTASPSARSGQASGCNAGHDRVNVVLVYY